MDENEVKTDQICLVLASDCVQTVRKRRKQLLRTFDIVFEHNTGTCSPHKDFFTLEKHISSLKSNVKL